MKANELMIGDWVLHHNNGCIDAMNDTAPYDEAIRIEQDDFELDECFWGRLDPIPLTPEILEKNGWYRAEFDGGYGRKAMRLEGPYNELNELPEGVENALFFAQWSIDESFEYHLLDIYMWKGNVHLWIEYVHELQRALRCCGLVKLADSFAV